MNKKKLNAFKHIDIRYGLLENTMNVDYFKRLYCEHIMKSSPRVR